MFKRQWLSKCVRTILPSMSIIVSCDQESTYHPQLGKRIGGLPSFTRAEIAKHVDKEKGVWVTYKDGVYDITNFISKHPGGEKILLGAGKSVEPFWRLYAQHLNLPSISHLMEDMRIGNLDESESVEHHDDQHDNPYQVEETLIQRHPGLVFLTQRPANAEVPPSLLCDSFLTPNEIFFVRHHFPVPEPKPDEEVNVSGIKGFSALALETAFDQHEVIATIQCTGNRRTGFKSCNVSKPSEVKGLPWSVGAISTAKWSGPKLADVLNRVYPQGIPEDMKHVCFTGRDSDGSGQFYGVSINLEHAMDPRGEVILALKMNDEPLPLDHGAPVRVIVPGTAGCRSVKWLKEIFLSETESTAFWQKQDYKSFSPSQGWEGLDFDSAPSVMFTPVQSAICEYKIFREEEKKPYIVAKGYSFSGGGNSIIRVDVSADGGRNWTNADLDSGDHSTAYKRRYSWTLWTAVVDIPHNDDKTIELVVKAVDEGYNSQPETPDSIWNVRGILNNSWHRIFVGEKN